MKSPLNDIQPSLSAVLRKYDYAAFPGPGVVWSEPLDRLNTPYPGASCLTPQEGPSRESISEAAYGIFEDEGRVPGNDQSHWYEAEAQLRYS